MAMLGATLEDAAGVEITYTRGVSSQTTTAVVGRTVFTQNTLGAPGPAVIFGDRDYLIPVANLTLTGPAVPKDGDRITEVIDGATLVFEVKSPITGEPVWRYSDPGRTRYRIHTKRVG